MVSRWQGTAESSSSSARRTMACSSSRAETARQIGQMLGFAGRRWGHGHGVAARAGRAPLAQPRRGTRRSTGLRAPLTPRLRLAPRFHPRALVALHLGEPGVVGRRSEGRGGGRRAGRAQGAGGPQPPRPGQAGWAPMCQSSSTQSTSKNRPSSSLRSMGRRPHATSSTKEPNANTSVPGVTRLVCASSGARYPMVPTTCMLCGPGRARRAARARSRRAERSSRRRGARCLP